MDRTDFIERLLATNRKGIDGVLKELEELGFYDAPASSKFHLSCKGGLLEHSMNVYEAAILIREQAIKLHPELEKQRKLSANRIDCFCPETSNFAVANRVP